MRLIQWILILFKGVSNSLEDMVLGTRLCILVYQKACEKQCAVKLLRSAGLSKGQKRQIKVRAMLSETAPKGRVISPTPLVNHSVNN